MEDDIIRDINVESANDCAAEITRLKRKRRGFKASFTEIINIVDKIILASISDDLTKVNRSQDNLNTIQRSFEKLEVRYDKYQKLNHRILDLNQVEDDTKEYQKILDDTCKLYMERIEKLGNFRLMIMPDNQNAQQGVGGGPGNQSLRPVQALKPSFNLSLDNSPTELSTWLSQFKSYFETSKLFQLPSDQQQAFLRQGLEPDVWTVIKGKINLETRIFRNPLDHNEETCETIIEEAFAVRYPLIMRRYKFFTYERKGNQTYSAFHAKLQELAAAANLENLDMNDYLCFRIIAGLNDPKSVDKILSIPAQDFTLEEVNRVAVACETARNYASLNSKNTANATNSSHSSQKPPTGQDKLKALKQQGKCVRCGKKAHEKGSECPHRNTTCHKCGIKGHISPVCAKNGTNSGKSHYSTKKVNTANYTFVGAVYGPRATPRQKVSFQSSTTQFYHDCVPDSGSSRTIFGKNLLDSQGIKIEPNLDSEELYNASNSPMTVNGKVQLTATFQGKSKLIDGLVSEDLKDQVLLSWYDAEDLGSLSITRFTPLPVLGKPNKQKIEKLKQKFESILRDTISEKPMSGAPMKLHFKKEALKKGIKPKKVFTASQTPIHLKPAADKVLAEAIKNKLIEEVPVNEPSEWCSRGFFVAKPNGGARLVVDLSYLNQFIERPVHPFVAGADLLKNLDPKSRVFCKLDAVLGYYQIPIAEESKKYFTFLLASGRYRLLRAPMGCSASSDEWCKRSDAALSGIPGLHKLVDDILIEAENYDTLFERIEMVLQRCVLSNITISLKKMEIGETVVFAGYKISSGEIHPIDDRVAAIKNYPTPTTTKELKGFLGLSNQLGHFVPDLTHSVNELRQLLKKNVAWQWLPDQEKAFKTTKEILGGPLILKTFNPNYETELVTDASRIGLGFALLQVDPLTGNRQLVQCGSRSLTGPESRWAVCELEILAIFYAITKCRHYLLGMEHFTVITDHKPLKGVFGKELCDIENARLRRYRERLTGYSFDIVWREGKTNQIADALSRAPIFPAHEETDESADVCHAITALQKDPDPILAPMIKAAKNDTDYQSTVDAIGKIKNPKSLPTDHPSRQLNSVWSQLSIDDSGLIVLDGKRIFVPKSQRKGLLNDIHAAHCGMNKTQWRAKDLYFWKGMSSEINMLVQDCELCRPFLPSQGKEPIIPGISATGPMTDVGTDLFQIGHNHYIVMMDRYSGFPFVEKLTKLSTSAIIKVLTTWFNTFGWPERLRSDNGPQYRSEFDEFCKDNNIIHENSSPYCPQSNGLSEAAVKQMKYLLQKCNQNLNDFHCSLLEFRNTTNVSGKSPAQMFFGRRLRGKLPHLPGANDLDISNAKDGADNRNKLMNQNENLPGTTLQSLSVDQRVLLQNPISKSWDQTGIITAVRKSGRSYDVLLDSGKSHLRNRKFLRPISNTEEMPNSTMVSPDDQQSPQELRRSARLSKKNDK